MPFGEYLIDLLEILSININWNTPGVVLLGSNPAQQQQSLFTSHIRVHYPAELLKCRLLCVCVYARHTKIIKKFNTRLASGAEGFKCFISDFLKCVCAGRRKKIILLSRKELLLRLCVHCLACFRQTSHFVYSPFPNSPGPSRRTLAKSRTRRVPKRCFRSTLFVFNSWLSVLCFSAFCPFSHTILHPLVSLQFAGWVDAVIFVFSLENEGSFNTVYNYYTKMAHFRNGQEIPMILVGTQGKWCGFSIIF